MQQELDIYIRARYPLLWVVTPEEERALAEIEALAKTQRKRLLLLERDAGTVKSSHARQNGQRQARSARADDVHFGRKRTLHLGAARFSSFFERANRRAPAARSSLWPAHASNKTVILLGGVLRIPPELEKEVTVLDFALPDAQQLQQTLTGVVESAQRNGKIEVVLDKRQRTRLIQACLGLTENEAADAIAKAIVQAGGRLAGEAVEAVTAEKQQIIRKSGLLEFYATEERLTNVGGLETLKEWLRKRVRAFSDEARAFGLPEPKGILLVGIQGCGKSLVAKSVANSWRLPLLRLDVGRLFSSLVGSSEENLRNAIKVAESIAPVVLWVDEIEKGFSGVGSSNVSDAGTAARVFGSFITWLQEKESARFRDRHRQSGSPLAAGIGAQRPL